MQAPPLKLQDLEDGLLDVRGQSFILKEKLGHKIWSSCHIFLSGPMRPGSTFDNLMLPPYTMAEGPLTWPPMIFASFSMSPVQRGCDIAAQPQDAGIAGTGEL
eukprot:9409942-Heterocapsa_arctica.AAC.1